MNYDIKIKRVNNGIILETQWEMDLFEFWEGEDGTGYIDTNWPSKNELGAIVRLLWGVNEIVWFLPSKHSKYNLNISIDENN